MKILVSAFEPFNGEKINPSMKLLAQLQPSADLAKVILPVSYARAFPAFLKQFDSAHISHVLLLGQAGGRALLGMERVALNWQDSSVADEDGVTIYESNIHPAPAPPAFFTEYPLRLWLQEAQAQQLPLEISNSAGAFICNSLSYEVAAYLKANSPHTKSLFLHVPYLPEQIVDKPPGTACLEFSQMQKAVEFVIAKMLATQNSTST